MIRHIFQLYFYSFIATLGMLPLSALDAYYIASFNKYSLLITFPLMLLFEIINANIGYKFSAKISKIIVRTKKLKEKMKKVEEEQEKVVNDNKRFILLILVATTPLPYTLMIYYLGAIKWANWKKFSLAILIGRTIKYIGIGLIVYFGISLF